MTMSRWNEDPHGHARSIARRFAARIEAKPEHWRTAVEWLLALPIPPYRIRAKPPEGSEEQVRGFVITPDTPSENDPNERGYGYRLYDVEQQVAARFGDVPRRLAAAWVELNEKFPDAGRFDEDRRFEDLTREDARRVALLAASSFDADFHIGLLGLDWGWTVTNDGRRNGRNDAEYLIPVESNSLYALHDLMDEAEALIEAKGTRTDRVLCPPVLPPNDPEALNEWVFRFVRSNQEAFRPVGRALADEYSPEACAEHDDARNTKPFGVEHFRHIGARLGRMISDLLEYADSMPRTARLDEATAMRVLYLHFVALDGESDDTGLPLTDWVPPSNSDGSTSREWHELCLRKHAYGAERGEWAALVKRAMLRVKADAEGTSSTLPGSGAATARLRFPQHSPSDLEGAEGFADKAGFALMNAIDGGAIIGDKALTDGIRLASTGDMTDQNTGPGGYGRYAHAFIMAAHGLLARSGVEVGMFAADWRTYIERGGPLIAAAIEARAKGGGARMMTRIGDQSASFQRRSTSGSRRRRTRIARVNACERNTITMGRRSIQ